MGNAPVFKARKRSHATKHSTNQRIVDGMTASMERDRYLFGALDSSAKNRSKLDEATYSFEPPEGVILT